MKCEEVGCNNEALACQLNNDEDTVEYFCPSHAQDHGYCWLCGNFAAGTEGFDFCRPQGLCDNCRSEIEEDIDDEEISEYSDLT